MLTVMLEFKTKDLAKVVERFLDNPQDGFKPILYHKHHELTRPRPIERVMRGGIDFFLQKPHNQLTFVLEAPQATCHFLINHQPISRVACDLEPDVNSEQASGLLKYLSLGEATPLFGLAATQEEWDYRYHALPQIPFYLPAAYWSIVYSQDFYATYTSIGKVEGITVDLEGFESRVKESGYNIERLSDALVSVRFFSDPNNWRQDVSMLDGLSEFLR